MKVGSLTKYSLTSKVRNMDKRNDTEALAALALEISEAREALAALAAGDVLLFLTLTADGGGFDAPPETANTGA